MRFFLRSPQFKKTVAIIAVVLALAIVAGLIGGRMSPQAGILGAVAAPFQKLGNSVVNAIETTFNNFQSAAVLNNEKEQLQNEVNKLREQLTEYEEAVNQNEFYEKYLNIKDLNPDFEFAPAKVLASDPDDIFHGFTVSVGSFHGISLYDPVITDEGVVGYISEVGITTSKVTTILDPELVVGAFDSRTGDAGVVSGSTEYVNDGYTRFYNLPRTCSVAVGDLVITSGSGIFPDGLILGNINNIASDPISSSLFATITPTVNFDELKQVMVITKFEGQGNYLTDGE
ncbi:MAG: rod shape-determining protein MreC [Clostridia bacterium]|nr:rod shape-determining protein MreC [Clostridia bacterium]